MRKGIRGLSAIMLVCAACQPGREMAVPALTDEYRAALADSLDSVVADWWEAWNRIDVDRGMSFISDSPDVSWAQDGSVIYTKRALEEVMRQELATIGGQQIQVLDSRTVILSPDLAYSVRKVAATHTDLAGNQIESEPLQYLETIVWARENGSWRFLMGHGSTPGQVPLG